MLLVSVTHKCSVAIERCYHSNPLVNHPITNFDHINHKKREGKTNLFLRFEVRLLYYPSGARNFAVSCMNNQT